MSKEELYQKYIIENLSIKECALFFNVGITTIKRKLKEYNFSKSKKQISELLSISQKKFFLDEEVLYDLYIEQNLSLQECADRLGVGFHIVQRRLREFGIKKPQSKFKEIHRSHANQTVDSLEKRKATILKKYGVDNVSKSDVVKSKKKETTKGHYGVVNPFQSSEVKKRISQVVEEKYGVLYSCMRQECRKYSGNSSKPNQQFANILDGLHIEYEKEFPLKNYSYDFKVGNLLFEINPTVFHNSTFSPVGSPKDMMYHAEKSLIARRNGFHCIHIFDWDDKEKIIKTFLLPKERIYARECDLREVDLKDARTFLNENHLQGYARDEIRLGLYYNNELVSIMTFGKPRYNKKYEYELVRLCSIANVVGGAEKLLNAFIDQYKPKNIISYCDLSKFDGKIYKKLGFETINKPHPSKHWFSMKTGQHITDNLLRQKGFDQLFKTNYGKGTSNEELMLEHGFVEIYDCGQLTLVKQF